MDCSTIESVKKAYDDLYQVATEFSDLFLKSSPTVKYLAKLPFPSGQVPGNTLLDSSFKDDRYTVISHMTNCNEEKDVVARILTSLDYEAGQDRKSTLRMPGFVVVCDEVVKKAKELNVVKNSFKIAVLGLPPGQSKAALRRALDCCFLHCYRNILVIDTHIEALSFSWVSVNHSVKKTTVNDLRNKINAYYESPPAAQAVSGDVNGNTGEKMASLLAGLPDNEIVAIKRPVKPHVKVNYKLCNSTWKSADGSMPVILSENSAEDIKTINQLSLSTKKRTSRDSVYAKEPLIEKLNCYRYKVPQYA
jgi:hypothetical protein